MSGWESLETEPGVVHVHPLGDLIEHDVAGNCACGPDVEIVVNADGPDGHVWAHHSLDGRERHEKPGPTFDAE